MNDFTKILTASSLVFIVSLALPGCGESSSPTSGERHSADDGHNHAEGEQSDHQGQDHAEGEPEEHVDNSHGGITSLGKVTIAGTTLAVSASGDFITSSEIDLDIDVEAGPIPAAVRYWIGDESGAGAMKSKADGHGDHFHGQIEVPASVAGASLWIEVESASGERTLASMPLR